ncbi:Sphinganine kinase protein [Dioscorea alata]|uniref:Sphinganine kinase protein n=2 Tax=Dioscorea alata TaxID=55571 RepID=A0ACB7UPA5_DIOAL|nr:Sphinganine kinase protein [Dioscorea alata]KAH7662345.1 Sphinganine kinase protein [Dioscorea alata]
MNTTTTTTTTTTSAATTMASKAQVLTERIQVDGDPVEAVLDHGTGELRWRSGDDDRRLFVESEMLGIKMKGMIITIRAFVDAPERCCFGSSSGKRVRRDFQLEMPSETSAMMWTERLKDCIDSLGRPKRLFIIVNPFGGRKVAPEIFQNEVRPLMEAAGILYTVQETNHRLHAQEIAQSMNLDQYDGIVCVSGDGILAEVVNGLLQREDWHTAIKMPLGIVPAGTSNGMAKSLLDSVGQLYSISNAAFSIIRGHTRKLDVASVLQGEAQFFSVLMLTWGFMADVDIESEKYRWMGSARIGFYSLLRVMNLRKYHGCVKFVPAPGYELYGEPLCQDEISKDDPPMQESRGGFRVRHYQGPQTSLQGMEWRSINGPFVLVCLNNVPWPVEDVLLAPEAKFSDGYLDMTIIRDCPKTALLMMLLKMDEGNHVKSDYVMHLKVKALRLEPGQCVGNPKKGGIVDCDGEIIARGEDAYACHQIESLMAYGPPIQVTVDKGLATIFSPR